MDARKKIVLKTILSIIAAFLLQTGLPAQERTVSPFVSGLGFEIRNNMLRLSWVDSPDLKGPVHIYRSLSPFRESAAALRIRPIVIPYGREFYIDEIDFSGTYYYFVAASDEYGAQHIIFNQGNTTDIYIDNPGLAHEIPDITAQGIYYLSTRVVNNRVIINFGSTEFANNVLYRGTRPIRNAQDLSGALIIRDNAVSPVNDFPVPGIPYYYALVPETDLSQDSIRIIPGINSTTESVIITAETARPEDMRNVPLPLISMIHAAPETASRGVSRTRTELNPEAERALDFIPNREPEPVPLRSIIILPEDMNAANNSEEYLLGSIIMTSFISQNWETAKDELAGFISMSRSRAPEARARFYLGQCYLYLNEPRAALLNFLEARSVYPFESAEWIQAALRSITSPLP